MTSAADMAIPRAPRLGKRILRLLLWTLAGIVVFFVLLFLASRTASDAVREIEAERATGLASTVSFARAQPFTLLRSVGNLQITRAASLLLKTRDFDSTRARMEAIVRSNKGYFDELQVGVREGSGHALTATFHVPVEQLDAVCGGHGREPTRRAGPPGCGSGPRAGRRPLGIHGRRGPGQAKAGAGHLGLLASALAATDRDR